jgi:hypothetical protein
VTRSKWWLLVDLAGIVPLVVTLVFAGILVAYEYRILRDPMTTHAVVVEKLDSERRGEHHFDFRYRFVAASGGEYDGWIAASREIFDRTSVGDPIDIRYAGDAPEYREITTDMRGPLFNISAIGGAATLLVPVVSLAWVGFRRLRSDLREIGRRG